MLRIYSVKQLALVVLNQRKKLKLSQAAVGELVGLKQKTISAFENNPEGTQLETLFKILSAVNLDIFASPKNQINVSKKKHEEW